MKNTKLLLSITLITLFITACGGGGGSSDSSDVYVEPVALPNSFSEFPVPTAPSAPTPTDRPE